MDWKLADAKNKFSEVVNLALNEGPQRVVRRDEAVIIISQDDYKRLKGKLPSFSDFLTHGEDFDSLELKRDKTSMRDLEL